MYFYDLFWIYIVIIDNFFVVIFYKKIILIYIIFIADGPLFLSNNTNYSYIDFKLLRYVLIILSFIALLAQQNLKFKFSYYIIPFTIFSFISTIILQDFSIDSTFRVFSFFLIFLIIHSYVCLFMRNKQGFLSIFKLSIIFLLVNFFYVFVDGYLEGRFRGLFGNQIE